MRTPSSTESPEAARIRELEAEREELKLQLFGAQVREEIARVMPKVQHAPAGAASKKKAKPRRRRRGCGAP